MSLGTARETNESASDRRGLERLGETLAKGVGVSGRQAGSNEIERAAGRCLGNQRHQRQSGTIAHMSPTIAAKSRSRQGFSNGSSPECPRIGPGQGERLLARYCEK